MSTLYVVDDSEEDRAIIVRLLEESWEKNEGPSDRPDVEERDVIWDLIEGNDLKEGDVVIADLYPTEYWKEVPPPRPIRVRPRPKDPTNFFNATVDIVERFLSKVPERGAELIVMTYIPHFMEWEIGVPIAGEKLRELLESQKLILLEKKHQHQDEDCSRKAVEAANEVLSK